MENFVILSLCMLYIIQIWYQIHYTSQSFLNYVQTRKYIQTSFPKIRCFHQFPKNPFSNQFPKKTLSCSSVPTSCLMETKEQFLWAWAASWCISSLAVSIAAIAREVGSWCHCRGILREVLEEWAGRLAELEVVATLVHASFAHSPSGLLWSHLFAS